jgi:septation ring formation regulator EzrA
MSEMPGVPKKYLNAFSAKDGHIVSTGEYGFEVPGVPEEYLTCLYDTDQEMANPTTIDGIIFKKHQYS